MGNSKKINLEELSAGRFKKVAVCACDSGASRHISKWLKDINQEFSYYLKGPAIEIFNFENQFHSNFSLEECIEDSNLLITGTGWSTDLEISAIKLAKEKSIYTVSVLDHWVNYRERFLLNGQYIFPDQIWVSDKLAFDIAFREFPDIPIVKLPNLWINNLKSKVELIRYKNNIKNSKSLNMLYFLEPIRVKWEKNSKEKCEFQSIRYFFEKIEILKSKKLINTEKSFANFRFRLHPSEEKQKYFSFLRNFDMYGDIEISKSKSLEEDLAWGDYAFGIDTQALIASMECGIKSFVTKPEWAGRSLLPHENLIHLSDIK